MASRRAAWRTLSDIQENEDYEKSKGNSKNVDLVKEYKKTVENELRGFCDDILELLEGLIKSAQDKESKVFYKKMKGDYYRYMCEIHTAET